MASPEQDEMLRLLRENSLLVKENNKILRRLHKFTLIGLAFRVIWYTILIGFPFAIYFYLIQPYFNALGSDYEVFRLGIEEIPGIKGLGRFME